MTEEDAKVCVFIKKRRNIQLRKTGGDDDQDGGEAAGPKESKIPKPAEDSEELNVRRQRRDSSSSNSSSSNDEAPEPQRRQQQEADSSGDSDNDVAGNLAAIKDKLKKKSVLTQSTKRAEKEKDSIIVKFNAEKSAKTSGPADGGATATYELDTEFDKDTQATFERAKKIHEEFKKKETDDKVYRGMNNYQQFYEKRDTAQGNASSGLARAKGPIRAPAHLRATVVWDYQPDVCKDYKETGYCGFGDSCKFMHDRSDYKHGWQLEQEWQEKQGAASAGREPLFKRKQKKNGDGDGEEDDDANDDDPNKYVIKGAHSDEEDDDLPFRCIICRQSFTNPVVTKCKHYFCEKCFVAYNKKNSRCYACKTQTNGIFFVAKDIVKKMAEAKALAEAAAEKQPESSDSD